MRTFLFTLILTTLSFISCFSQSWLYLPNGYVQVGDVDVVGDHLTVEAIVTMTTTLSAGQYELDIVSKHQTSDNVNYLLRPDRAQITTKGSGHVAAVLPCYPEENQCYHLAMVYNGSTLSLYINGVLGAQVAATDSLINNDLITTIGNYACCPGGDQFYGYVDEVRIWNVARTQAEIQTYMYSSLPSPTTQTGLLAYYQFNSLTNKQGNSQWDGALHGSATIGNTNSVCNSLSIFCCPGLDPVPSISYSGPATVCLGADLTVSAGIGWDNYLWMPGGKTTRSIAVNATGSYTVTATSSCGTGSAQAFVTVVNPPLLSVSNNTSVCLGYSAVLSAQEGYKYIWNTGATSSSVTVQPNVSSLFTVIATNDFGCKDTGTTIVFVNALPILVLNNDERTVCSGSSVQLIASGAASYLWSTGEVTAGITVTPDVHTTFSITGTDQNDCSSSIYMDVIVKECESLYIPAAFTPDKDGINDIFSVEISGITGFQMFIYDRWGKMIFQTDNTATGWDGTFVGGQDVQQDIYLCVLKGKWINGEDLSKIMFVTLLR